MDLALYQAFVTTVAHGNITAAAAELGVSRPTLSRQLAALEAELGLALLHRTTRSVKPTALGRRIYEQARPHLDGLARLEVSARDEREGVLGTLRVSVPPVIADEIARVLVALRREHPRLTVELLADIRWADLRSDGVEVALRAGRVRDPELVRRKLGARDVYAVASPRYLEKHGALRVAEDLASHDVLLGISPEGEPQRTWPLRDGGRVTVSGGFVSDDQVGLMAAAEADGGIALVSEVSAARAIAAGRLVQVLPDLVGARLVLYAVHAQRRRQPARVRAFIDALVKHFAKGPWR
ncbi:MAG: LysR family transcriptional regulator [Sandaracinaceae bacterium]